MIQLTKMNDEIFILNAILIEQIQSLPDTTITLINGKKLLVKNAHEEVVHLTTMFYKQVGLQQVHKQVGDESE